MSLCKETNTLKDIPAGEMSGMIKKDINLNKEYTPAVK
jgi:hypothetical protein